MYTPDLFSDSLISGQAAAAVKWLGIATAVLITIIGVRYVYYFVSFFFSWKRYRKLDPVSTRDLLALPEIPYVKIMITTRGSEGSTTVITRGIYHAADLVDEEPGFYGRFLSVEVFTESAESKKELDRLREIHPALSLDVVQVPTAYLTPKLTAFKARGLHYAVEQRRAGFNRKPGRTFIVHYDEESVLERDELRKLIHHLAHTPAKLLEGPIYYPFEYCDAGAVCRAMEANRPINCYECRHVMEAGTPFHLHGSNLVIDEELENRLGWDIGLTPDGQPFIAEDYVFGVLAYLAEGPGIFGWHGCAMLEQPPFSVKSAFRQRYRWILGVLQGIQQAKAMPEFRQLPRATRFHLIWGTRYRIMTFALGLPAGLVSGVYILAQTLRWLSGQGIQPLPLPVMLWLVFVGFLWLNSILIGCWYNVSSNDHFTHLQRWIETTRVVTTAPFAGVIESTAAFKAVVFWTIGRREVVWVPTPKTKAADEHATGKEDVHEMAM